MHKRKVELIGEKWERAGKGGEEERRRRNLGIGGVMRGGGIENIFMGKHFKGIFIGQHGGWEGL
jgi:hypothetical protein